MIKEQQSSIHSGTTVLELSIFAWIPITFTALGVIATWLFSGGGHGTEFFSELFAAPFAGAMNGAWLGPLILWLPVALLMPFRSTFLCRVAAAMVLVIHYVGVGVLIKECDWHFIQKVWNAFNPLPAIWILVYCTTQVALLFLLSTAPKGLRRRRINFPQFDAR